MKNWQEEIVPWGDLEQSLAEKEEAAKQKSIQSTQSYIYRYMYVCMYVIALNNKNEKQKGGLKRMELHTMFSRARNWKGIEGCMYSNMYVM